MKVRILEVSSKELIRAIIRSGQLKELPSLHHGWRFDFGKQSRFKDKSAFVLVKEESPDVIEGCMIFSIHEAFGPFLDYLEVAPHNKGNEGKYKRISGSLIAYACGLSFETGLGLSKGILTFKVSGYDISSTSRLENWYREHYGAIVNPFGYMEIHQDQTRQLIEEYLFDDKKD